MNAWQEVLNFLKTKVNPQSYQTWLRPTRFSHVANDTLVVRVPNHEFRDWIQEHYGGLVQEALSGLGPGIGQVTYVFEENAERKTPENGESKAVQGKLDFDSIEHQLNPRYTFETFVVGS